MGRMFLLAATLLVTGCINDTEFTGGADPADAAAPHAAADLTATFDPIDQGGAEDLATAPELIDLAPPLDTATPPDLYDPCFQGCTYCKSEDPRFFPAYWWCYPCGYVNGKCVRDFSHQPYHCSPDDLGPCH